MYWPIQLQCRPKLLNDLDRILSGLPPELIGRGLATMADTLAIWAGAEGGLRSGPARNRAWLDAISAVSGEDVPTAVRMLAAVRSNWLDSPDRCSITNHHLIALECI